MLRNSEVLAELRKVCNQGITLRPCLVHLHIVEPPTSPSYNINVLYTCLSAKITNKFESNNIKFHKSSYAETGKLEGPNLWVYKTGLQSYKLYNCRKGKYSEFVEVHNHSAHHRVWRLGRRRMKHDVGETSKFTYWQGSSPSENILHKKGTHGITHLWKPNSSSSHIHCFSKSRGLRKQSRPRQSPLYPTFCRSEGA